MRSRRVSGACSSARSRRAGRASATTSRRTEATGSTRASAASTRGAASRASRAARRSRASCSALAAPTTARAVRDRATEMLSLRELERAAAILRREIAGHRIQQAVQSDETTVALELFGGDAGGGRRRWISISCDPERARVGELSDAPGGSGPPLRFAQYLRAHLRGARVRDVELIDGERQLALRARGAGGD